MGTQNGHIVPFLESEFLKKMKGKAMAGVKQIAKMCNIDKFHLLSVLKQKLRTFVGTSLGSFLEKEII